MQEFFKKLIDEIGRAESVLLVSHQNPDPDTVGSALALGRHIESMGKSVRYFCADKIPANFYFLAGAEKFSGDCEAISLCNLIIFLDCSDFSRTGLPPGAVSKGERRISIDHHIFKENFWDWEIRDSNASATCEIIYDFLKATGRAIGPAEAEALLAGIALDTGYFSNMAARRETFIMAAELISLGADYGKIIKSFYMNKDVRALALWGAGLSRLKFNKSRNIATTAILRSDFSDAEEAEEIFGGFSNFLNASIKADAVIVFRETAEGVRGSVRAIGGAVNAAEIAAIYGGGGHEKAAGFTCRGRVAEGKDGWMVERD